MIGDDVFGSEIFHQLDDLEALPWREPEKGPEEPQAFDGLA